MREGEASTVNALLDGIMVDSVLRTHCSQRSRQMVSPP